MLQPDFEKAASLAGKCLFRFGGNPSAEDLLSALSRFPNVSTYALSINSIPGRDHWDAFSCVREKNGALQYIIVYNALLDPSALAFVLAREFGHVVLSHDGTSPEAVWMSEAVCFAFHLLSDPAPVVPVFFRPDSRTLSASFKAMRFFDNMDALKKEISVEQTRLRHFVGRSDVVYSPGDVEICFLDHQDIFGGWKNYSSVMLDGRLVGYCGT